MITSIETWSTPRAQHARTRHASARVATLAASLLLLSACSTFRNGYPNHTMEPSLTGQNKPATDNKAMYLSLIQQLQQQGAYYASLAHIDAFRLRYGNPPELQRMEGDALRETGQYAEADKAYQGLLHTDQAAAAWHGLGLIAAAGKQYTEAEQDLLQAVQLEPVNVTYLGDLGYARLAAGQVATAREPLAKAAELDPGNSKAVSNLALWALLNGDIAQADAIMQRANLPPATQAAVQRLAVQLRVVAPIKSTSDTSAPAAAASQSAASQQTEPASGVQVAGIPGALLDRLGTPTASTETHP